MAVKERSQIKGTDAQIKAFAGHNGVLAFATDTKSIHVLSGTAGTTTEFLPSNKVATKTELGSYATKTELANYTPTASLATVATSGSYNDLSDKPVVDSALSSTSTNAIQNKVVKAQTDTLQSNIDTKLTEATLRTALTELITEYGGTVPT